MENCRSYEEGAGSYLLNLLLHEHDLCFLECSFERRLEEALFFPTQQLCTSSSTTQSFFWQDELDAPFQGDSSIWADMEQGAHDKAQLCTSSSTTQSCLLQDEFDTPFEDDSLWADMEQGTHRKGEKELKQEVGGDAAKKKREGSEETVFSSTQHLCTSTTTAQSCLSQDSEGDNRRGEKDLKEELGRGAGEKKRNGPAKDTPLLTLELVSQYYCMPIKQAAEELNVGLTHLKRRCRELGIPRWPHRQVKSLQRLIKNVQELGSDTGEPGGRTKIVVEMLQQAKKLIEESPAGVGLDHRTKVLRQAFFKENYKRRRLMAIEG